MKYFWILFLGLTSIAGFSQTDTARTYQIYYSFSDPAKAEWTAFENEWSYFDFSQLKKLYKIKSLNCKNCESLFADVYIEINEEGKIDKAHFIKGKKCGIPCIEKEFTHFFENSLKKRSFKVLKNMKFIVRLGNALKC